MTILLRLLIVLAGAVCVCVGHAGNDFTLVAVGIILVALGAITLLVSRKFNQFN